MKLKKRILKDYWSLSDKIGSRFKGSNLKKRQIGCSLLWAILCLLLGSLSVKILPLLIALTFWVVINIQLWIVLSTKEFPFDGSSD